MKWVVKPIYKSVDTGEVDDNNNSIFKEELDFFEIQHRRTSGVGPKGTITIYGPDIPKPHASVVYEEGKIEIVEDFNKKTEQEEKDESNRLIKIKLKRMDFGKRIIAMLSIRNDSKSLSGSDIVSLQTTYANPRAALQDGSITTAKVLIEAITPDEILITTEDKSVILSEINQNLESLGYTA